jgi:hypothetical protein
VDIAASFDAIDEIYRCARLAQRPTADSSTAYISYLWSTGAAIEN